MMTFPLAPAHGRLCTAGRLRRRGAVLRETPPSPQREGVISVRGRRPLHDIDSLPPWGGPAEAT